MTILCVTNDRLPGIRPCTIRGVHRVTCHDHPGWTENPGTCTGCLPRAAARGFLCHSCYDRVDAAHLKWRQFVRLVIETDGRAVTQEGGGIKSAAPDGFTNLPLTFLALDECDRLLRSLSGKTLEAWVHTEAGARDAIMFAHAAERAYRTLEVEARPLQLERVRCPHCGLLSLSENPTRRKLGSVIVECQHCGELLDKIRDTAPRWVGSETCEHGAHAECGSLHCRCDCHTLGDGRAVGPGALWNADTHRVHPSSASRGDWVIENPGRIRRLESERKTA